MELEIVNFDSWLERVRKVATRKYDDFVLIHMPHYVRRGKEYSESIERRNNGSWSLK